MMKLIIEITLGAYDSFQITEIIKVEANVIREADKNTMKSQMEKTQVVIGFDIHNSIASLFGFLK